MIESSKRDLSNQIDVAFEMNFDKIDLQFQVEHIKGNRDKELVVHAKQILDYMTRQQAQKNGFIRSESVECQTETETGDKNSFHSSDQRLVL